MGGTLVGGLLFLIPFNSSSFFFGFDPCMLCLLCSLLECSEKPYENACCRRTFLLWISWLASSLVSFLYVGLRHSWFLISGSGCSWAQKRGEKEEEKEEEEKKKCGPGE